MKKTHYTKEFIDKYGKSGYSLSIEKLVEGGFSSYRIKYDTNLTENSFSIELDEQELEFFCKHIVLYK